MVLSVAPPVASPAGKVSHSSRGHPGWAFVGVQSNVRPGSQGGRGIQHLELLVGSRIVIRLIKGSAEQGCLFIRAHLRPESLGFSLRTWLVLSTEKLAPCSTLTSSEGTA